jgi:hypothetical protein
MLRCKIFHIEIKRSNRKKSKIFNHQIFSFKNSIYLYFHFSIHFLNYFCVGVEVGVPPSCPNCDKKSSPDSSSEQP